MDDMLLFGEDEEEYNKWSWLESTEKTKWIQGNTKSGEMWVFSARVI